MLKRIYLPLLGLAIVASCSSPATSDENQEEVIDLSDDGGITAEPENDAPESYEKDGLKVYPFEGSPEFKTAELTRNSPADNMKAANGKVAFDFGVTNYELGAQTEGAGTNGLANSDKGQHIHLIVDNGPYSAHYDAKFEKEFEPGHHVAIAFLSRSFHESVKNGKSATIFQFTTGKDQPETTPVDLNAPMLFYSRPKGEYNGAGAQKILLDFYVANAELEPDGYSVIVTVNEKTEFILDTWQPYLIEGLPMGENTINLKMIDAQGNLADSPMNDVTRTFTLSAE